MCSTSKISGTEVSKRKPNSPRENLRESAETSRDQMSSAANGHQMRQKQHLSINGLLNKREVNMAGYLSSSFLVSID